MFSFSWWHWINLLSGINWVFMETSVYLWTQTSTEIRELDQIFSYGFKKHCENGIKCRGKCSCWNSPKLWLRLYYNRLPVERKGKLGPCVHFGLCAPLWLKYWNWSTIAFCLLGLLLGEIYKWCGRCCYLGYKKKFKTCKSIERQPLFYSKYYLNAPSRSSYGFPGHY